MPSDISFLNDLRELVVSSWSLNLEYIYVRLSNDVFNLCNGSDTVLPQVLFEGSQIIFYLHSLLAVTI